MLKPVRAKAATRRSRAMPRFLAGIALLCAVWPALGDTVLLENVNGYTLDGSRELVRFSALQFTDGEVDRIFGADDDLPENVDRRVDGAGRTVIPGLIDAHGHVFSHGRALLSVILTGAASEQEAAQRVADFAVENPEVEWIQGRGWNQVLWESNEFPGAASLDAVVSDRPVWLGRVDGHAAWANSLAMEMAGVTAQSEDPDGGQIIRDADGNPTGVFIDTAMGLVSGIIPEPGRDEIKRAISVSMQDLAGWGLTSVHDAGSGSAVIAAFRELLEAGEMPIRVNLMLAASDQFYEERLAEGHFRDANDFYVMHSV
ncbi:MAG: amidohydrolase family protein, partial [Gammaproteobacteria bacterium]|nr:amidohydrolase family protein [Gammaproteobacteria bacterium]